MNITAADRKQFSRSLRVLAFFIVACFSVLAVMGSQVQSSDAGTSDSSVMDLRPSVVGSPEQVLEAHGCWTGEAPADVTVPGHVVVRKDGHIVYGGSRLVGQALGQIFDGKNYNLTVLGFCR